MNQAESAIEPGQKLLHSRRSLRLRSVRPMCIGWLVHLSGLLKYLRALLPGLFIFQCRLASCDCIRSFPSRLGQFPIITDMMA